MVEVLVRATDSALGVEQDILFTLVEQLPRFRHSGQPGAFRAWLRTVATNRVRLCWRTQNYRLQAPGGSEFLVLLAELEDPQSSLSDEWNLDHQRHVLQSLLQELGQEFEPVTLEAFRRVALLDQLPSKVAQDLGMTVGAVYIAKSRVLRRLREEASELLD